VLSTIYIIAEKKILELFGRKAIFFEDFDKVRKLAMNVAYHDYRRLNFKERGLLEKVDSSVVADGPDLIFSKGDVCAFFGMEYFFQKGINILCFYGFLLSFGWFDLGRKSGFSGFLRDFVHIWVFK
jgi:hypothetical protein